MKGTDSSNPDKLVHKLYTNDPTYDDEWNIANIQFFRFANCYYDKAFEVRYGNPNILIDRLTNRAQEIFMENFLLYFCCNNSFVYSTPDYCKILRNIAIDQSTINNNSLCICPKNPSINNYCPNCQSGNEDCTSWLQLYRDFIALYPGSENVTSVLFTGNWLYDANGTVCNRSYAWYNHGITVQKIFLDSATYYSNTLPTLVHELSHSVGAPDHYHEPIDVGTPNERCRGGELCSVCGSNPRPMECIMRTTTEIDMNGSAIFCDGCKSDILDYLRN